MRNPIGKIQKLGTRRLILLSVTAGLATAVACSSSGETAATATSTPVPTAVLPDTETPTTLPVDPTATTTSTVQPPATDTPTGSSTPNPGGSSGVTDLFLSPTARAVLTELEGVELTRARSWQNQYNWFTDFDKRTVSLDEISNLLARDRIKPVDEPQFVAAVDAPDYMRPREPVIAVKIDGDARAYPLAILMWQEIANDVVGGVPVTITFCPLCNTAIAFERTLEGHELTFGTSGNLRNSDLVMWDRQTESWWQQITGEAIVGQLAGKVLEQIPSPIIAWETFLDEYPQGKLMLREVDGSGREIRPYDNPPYEGYDSVDTNPFAFNGPIDGRLPATIRVLTVKNDDASVAYPFSFLKDAPVLNDTIGSKEVVAFFDDGTLSAFLDSRFRDQTSGSTTVFEREVDGQTLTFNLGADGITDQETGSMWSVTGKATSGLMEGTELTPVIHQNHFWFAWAVFEPDTEVRETADKVSGPVSAAS